MLKENFVEYIENSIRKNWNIQGLSDYKGENFTYADIAGQIVKFHILFELSGIKKGDKIALIGKNSARWCIVYLAAVSYGAVIVPILADFKPDDVHHIVNHSDAKILFSGEPVYETLELKKMKNIIGVLSVNTYNLLEAKDKKFSTYPHLSEKKYREKYPDGLDAESFTLPKVSNSELAVISYTSGTTGFSKGVMLPGNSLAANIRFAQEHMPLNSGDPIVSFLPLAHTYGCAFEFLFPFSIGCHITFLTKTPSPRVITQAFGEIKPALILSVPLVIEKIYKKKLLPLISKWHMKILLKTPGINSLIYKKMNAQLSEAFGGNFTEVVIGGAPFNRDAEKLFRKIKFPFTVGYGMTECGPLISYESWDKTKFGSSGKPVDTLEVKIDSPEPGKLVGEIMLRGDNVMYGYYKNDKATKEILDKDGWLHTGDLGIMDRKKNIFIRGRNKSMILGANGKNIYPEEIESGINNMFAVSESLVVDRNDKLIALIHPDPETVEKHKLSENDLNQLFEQHRKELNNRLPSYMHVSAMEMHKEEFEKTPKRSIKRFVYQ